MSNPDTLYAGSNDVLYGLDIWRSLIIDGGGGGDKIYGGDD